MPEKFESKSGEDSLTVAVLSRRDEGGSIQERPDPADGGQLASSLRILSKSVPGFNAVQHEVWNRRGRNAIFSTWF